MNNYFALQYKGRLIAASTNQDELEKARQEIAKFTPIPQDAMSVRYVPPQKRTRLLEYWAAHFTLQQAICKAQTMQ